MNTILLTLYMIPLMLHGRVVMAPNYLIARYIAIGATAVNR